MYQLEAKNIVSGYGNLEVLHGISINAEKGKITCIIGPNGSGKSTLLKTIFGYLKCTKGEVILDGENITGLRPDLILKKGLSYIAQGRSIFPNMTVLENLKIGAYLLDDKLEVEKRIKEVFERFPILRVRKSQSASALSGGEQRMLELGRALLLRPKIILLDEPSLGLAPKIVSQTFDLFKKVVKEVTLVIVEQKVRQILEISDYAYLLALGEKKLEGASQELLKTYDVTRIFLPFITKQYS